jgi:hypothetical protein
MTFAQKLGRVFLVLAAVFVIIHLIFVTNTNGRDRLPYWYYRSEAGIDQAYWDQLGLWGQIESVIAPASFFLFVAWFILTDERSSGEVLSEKVVQK